MNYSDFVAGKLAVTPPTGLDEVPELHASLFPHQRDLVAWALRRGRCAIFADTGLGKSACEIEWARVVSKHTGKPVLILTPLAVAQQMRTEGERLGVTVSIIRDAEGVQLGINCCNYDRLHKLDPARFGGVVLDECFAEGTLIDTPRGARPIESIRVGDEIVNAFGVDRVADVHRREVPYGVKVTVRGRIYIASPNHPFFTQRGWVGARDLRRGDHVLETASSLSMVRSGVRSEVADVAAQTVLRHILLSELADEHAGTRGEGSQAGDVQEDRAKDPQTLRTARPSKAGGKPEANCKSEHDALTRDAREGLPPIERDEARTFRAWGQWSRTELAAIAAAGCVGIALAGGVHFITGSTSARLPHALQDRLSELRDQSGHRGGWFLALSDSAQNAGSEEGRETAFARVDGIEILEPGHPELERLRSPDGKLYFYDLGATRHPSFSVNGLVVHNSAVIKHHDAKRFRQLTDAFAATPFRLCATATPAPNDHTELGTHAEFLGICTRQEMLAEWFCHDGGETQVWRLKKHARGQFWRWVASWGALVRKPEDLGYENHRYDLPPFEVVQHVIPADVEQVRKTGLLFAEPAKSLTEQRQARRASLEKRVAECVARVAAEPDEPWVIWCDLNDEQDAIAEALGAECASVYGSLDIEAKELRIGSFVSGTARVLLSKTSICGWGLNLQRCSRMAFVGVSHSFESYYQAIRRIWRFGQTRPCIVHVIISELEGDVLKNLQRKQADAIAMGEALAKETREMVKSTVRGTVREVNVYAPGEFRMPKWLVTEES